jgi:hypothetical protein
MVVLTMLATSSSEPSQHCLVNFIPLVVGQLDLNQNVVVTVCLMPIKTTSGVFGEDHRGDEHTTTQQSWEAFILLGKRANFTILERLELDM